MNRLDCSGYRNIKTDVFIPEDTAYRYALDRCLYGTREDHESFVEELVSWFYSDDWIKEDADGTRID